MPFGRFSISGDRNLPIYYFIAMSIKLAILKDNEQVISDIKELVDDGKPVGYIFKDPHRVVVNQPFLIEKVDDDTSIQVTLTPWILLTTDKDIIVPSNHVVTIVEPLDSIKEMYLEKLNGSTSDSTDK